MISKYKLTKFCRKVVELTNGTPDKVVDQRSVNALNHCVFCYHPKWEEKEGCGIDHITVRPDGYGGSCFWITRTDGSETDISWTTALKYNGLSKKYKNDTVREACRSAVLPEILEIRNSIKLPFKCPVTGEVITDIHLVHIDHYDMEFDELFKEWLKDKDIEELYSHTVNGDGDMKTVFDSEDIINDFIRFHDAHTHLRVVSRTANLSVFRKKN